MTQGTVISESKKTQALHLLRNGHSARKVAKELGISNNTTTRWHNEAIGKISPRKSYGKVCWDQMYETSSVEKVLPSGRRVRKPWGLPNALIPKGLVFLAEDLRSEFMDILAVDPRNTAPMRELEEELSTWPSLQKRDHQPRPNRKLALLADVLDIGDELTRDEWYQGLDTEDLFNMMEPLWWEFRRAGFSMECLDWIDPTIEPSVIRMIDGAKKFVPATSATVHRHLEFIGGISLTKKPLERFMEAAEQVRKDLSKQESRRGPSQKARNLLMLKLGEIFDRYYEGENCGLDLRKTPGEKWHAPGCQCARHRLKLRFVKLALQVVSARVSNYPKERSRDSRFTRRVWKLSSPARRA